MAHRPHKWHWSSALLLGAALLAGCGSSVSENAESAANAPTPVTVAPVQLRALEQTERGIGTLQAKAQVELRPEVAGRINKLSFKEGSFVEQGQLLVALNDRKIRQQVEARKAELAAARATLQEAKDRYQRYQSLVKTNAVSKDEFQTTRTNFETAKARVNRLQAQLARAKERLGDTTLEAPFDGMISETEMDVGDYAAVGDHLATLYRTDVMETSFTLPEKYMGRVEQGQPVTFEVAAYPDRQFKGQVTYVSPSVNEQTRDFRIKAEVLNNENLLKPGAFTTAVLTIGVRKNRPVIPEEALVATRQGYIVFVVGPDSKARRQSVKIGLRNPGLVEIRKGLESGDRVVRTGHTQLSDGATVKVKSADSNTATASSARKADAASATDRN